MGAAPGFSRATARTVTGLDDASVWAGMDPFVRAWLLIMAHDTETMSVSREPADFFALEWCELSQAERSAVGTLARMFGAACCGRAMGLGGVVH